MSCLYLHGGKFRRIGLTPQCFLLSLSNFLSEMLPDLGSKVSPGPFNFLPPIFETEILV